MPTPSNGAPMSAVPDHVRDFARLTTWTGAHPVYVDGVGAPVILIHELNGLTEPILDFAERLRSHGFRVHLPVLFGAVPAVTKAERNSAAWTCCVSREIRAFRRGHTSPVVDVLRALAVALGPGPVGVIGMCMSGGFALAMASSPPVAAAVAAQPSVPFGVTPWHRRDLGMSADDVAAIRHRLGRDDVELYVTRFSADLISPSVRLERIEETFGPERLTVDVVESGRKNPEGFTCRAHSVLSVEPSKAHSDAARARLDRAADDVIAFLRRRLTPGSTSPGSDQST